jgi:transposase-like protein
LLDWAAFVVLLLGAALLFAYLFRSWQKKPKCPVCGSREIEKIPKQWVTAPSSDRGFPITVTSHYKYRCRKCQNEWEDY